MNPLSRFETIGIFSSIAVMALALAVLRFGSNAFTLEEPANEQAASVVSADQSIEKEIRDNVTANGLARLIVDDIKVGKGESVQEGDTVTVHYIGTLREGTQFDNSYLRGEPFTFTVGDGKVIKGWEEGILGMQVGGERILVVPADLAYGNRQVGPIPPNSPLVFALELLKIE